MSSVLLQEKLFNRNFILLCTCQLASGISFYMLMPVFPLYLTLEMGASTAVAGGVVSLYALAALLARPFSGPLVDGFQRKPLLVLSAFLLALAGCGYALTSVLVVFAMSRFMHGITFSISGTSLSTVAIDNIPPTKLGTGIGLFGMIVSLSLALGPMVGLLLMDVSYMAAYWGAVSFAVVAAILTMLVRAPRREIPPRKGKLFSPSDLFVRENLLPSLIFMMTIYTYGVTTNFVSLLAHERGMSEISGLFFLFFAGGLVLCRLYCGVLIDKGYMVGVIICGKLLVAGSLAVLILFGFSPVPFLGGAMGMGLGYGMCMPAYQTMMINLAPKEKRGTASSCYLLAMDLGVGISTLSGGMLAQMTSLSTTYAFGGALCVVSLILFLVRGLPLARRAASAHRH
ncbi:MFS transporter [Desulfovibrio sp. OttesenSCG-928-C06]|nr:MFS transporter [Desulfovibrio sp. OttesenSCG-928-C06]